MMVIDKLIDRIIELKNPTVIGLDPWLDMVPSHILKEAYETYGKTLKGAAMAFLRFNKEIIDEVCEIVPAVKPQIAMYEQYGADGIAAYIETIKYAKTKGLFVIGDVKRGDIGSTAEAYSNGHIGEVVVDGVNFDVFGSDFITVNPYLGFDAIEPFLNNCKINNRGLFVLVKTSNKGCGDFQDLVVGDTTVYEIIGCSVAKWGKDLIGKHGFSSICAVVGATHPEQAKKLRALMPNTFFLIPGYGAQGGTAKDLSVCFNVKGLGGIVNSSRGITAAYKTPKYNVFSEKEHAKAARQAALDMKADLLNHIKIN